MKLSTKSWHYSVYNLFYGGLPSNGCSYFWRLVLILTVSLSLIVFASMCIIGAVVIFFDSDSWLAGLGVITWILTFLAGVWWLLTKIENGIKWSSNPIPTKRKPNLIVEYWKAFKGKYCPRIEWEDDGV